MLSNKPQQLTAPRAAAERHDVSQPWSTQPHGRFTIHDVVLARMMR